MPEQNKQFKDFDICDFEDMGSLPKRPTNVAQLKRQCHLLSLSKVLCVSLM